MRIFKKKAIFLYIVIGLILAGVLLLTCRLLYINRHYGLSQWAKQQIEIRKDGLFNTSYYFVNNDKRYIVSNDEFDSCDVKQIDVKDGMLYMVNHARGYRIAFPKGVKFELDASNEFICAKTDEYSITVSKEFSPYEGTRAYIEEYINKFLLDERFQSQNKIKIHKNAVEKINDLWVQVMFAERTSAPMSDIEKNVYAYCYIYDKEQRYYRVMVKAKEYNREFIDTVYKMLYSFELDLPITGQMQNTTDYHPIENPKWNKETREFYHSLLNSDTLKWGIYVPQGVRDLHFDEVEKIEDKIDYTFDGMIEYLYYWEDFPSEGMQKAYDRGKIVEVTVQCSTVMNEELNGWSPAFDILDGVCDDDIRRFARAAKEFSHPFLFRLNNEMNSDWTSYCASILMNDPELYQELWKRYYRIFEEEGVNNAIWIFNPNDNTFPPCGYNDPKAYYPGNAYVHVFGVTGYNTGTYYAETFGEKWREFEDLYDEAYTLFDVEFGKFPWIITEFASSSVGGDKVQWINNMFDVLPKYKNIKMAFWFNSADWDPNYPKETVVSRPYWLDETDETLSAFGKRVKNTLK
ncbi:MAG: hypothetical protein IJT23_04435 [Clostridia bacterium]|nr:hypothetical protein [Clostridia bacterium]